MLTNDVIGGRGIGKKYENSEKRKKRENQMNKLKNELKRMDHKGYPAYKDLKGSYDFVKYTLNIEHVQGDPFASPSALSVRIKGKTADFPKNYYDVYHRRIALEDFI